MTAMIISFSGHGGETYVKLTWLNLALPALWLVVVAAFIILVIVKINRR
jgi:predicted small integral membrane protein